MPPSTTIDDAARATTTVLRETETLARALARPDLAALIETATERIERPDTVIAVVGEFKQGKSSLINGLIGEPICPVDDDLATSTLTVIRYGPTPTARVTVREGDETRVVEVNPAGLRQWVAEQRTAGEQPRVTVAEVEVDNPFLAQGITLVDPPGVSGLQPAYLAMTLTYLHVADAVIFVSDATAPLTPPELEFLRRAREQVPAVVAALTKIDLIPDWQAMAQRGEAQLAEAGMAVPLLPVSSFLRAAALGRRERDLNDESGFPALLAALQSRALEPAATLARERAAGDVRRVLGHLRSTAQSELDALRDPAGIQASMQELTAAREHLEALRSGASRWQTVLNDQFGDLVSNVEHRFRGRLRAATREAEEEIEANDPAGVWEPLTIKARQEVSEASHAVVLELEEGAAAIADEIVTLLKSEDVAVGALQTEARLPDIERLWTSPAVPKPNLASRAGAGFAGLRGAQGGVIMMGMVATLSGIAISTGAILGVGLVFGGKQLWDERKRQVTQRRQDARKAVRQYFDDAQFEVSKTMRDLSRELQRQLRDHFGARLTELTRTYAETADRLQRSLKQDERERPARIQALEQALAEAARLETAVPEVAS